MRCIILVCLSVIPIFAGTLLRPVLEVLPIGSSRSGCQLECGELLRIRADKMEDFNIVPDEKASLRCYMDKNNFYVRLYCEDQDILSEVKSPAVLRPGNAADAVQILLKSERDPGIWEFNVTANNIVNGFFHHSAGAVIPASSEKLSGATATVSCEGTLNNSKDRDKAWRVNVTIPKSVFGKKGFKFTPEEKWTVIVVRSNFGVYQKAQEISSFPQSVLNVYDPARYAELRFNR